MLKLLSNPGLDGFIVVEGVPGDTSPGLASQQLALPTDDQLAPVEPLPRIPKDERSEPALDG
jgi:hypothetical protein